MDVQTTAPWRKSTYSGSNGNCLEVAPTEDGVAIRNSNRPEAGIIPFTHAELDAFLKGAKDGQFDDLV